VEGKSARKEIGMSAGEVVLSIILVGLVVFVCWCLYNLVDTIVEDVRKSGVCEVLGYEGYEQGFDACRKTTEDGIIQLFAYDTVVE